MASVDPFTITTVIDHNVVIVTMEEKHNKMNILTSSFLDKLEACLDRLDRDYAGYGVVFTGNAKVFSAGLDLNILKSMMHFRASDSNQVKAILPIFEYVNRVDKLGERIFRMNRPTVAALNGHAIAGGTFIACACDYRVGVECYKSVIGLNEVRNGFCIPSRFLEVCSFVCGSKRKALEIFCFGEVVNFIQAAKHGLLTKLVKNVPRSEYQNTQKCGCSEHTDSSDFVYTWPVLGESVHFSALSTLLQTSVELVNHAPHTIPAYVATKLAMKCDAITRMQQHPEATTASLKAFYKIPLTESEKKDLTISGLQYANL